MKNCNRPNFNACHDDHSTCIFNVSDLLSESSHMANELHFLCHCPCSLAKNHRKTAKETMKAQSLLATERAEKTKVTVAG